MSISQSISLTRKKSKVPAKYNKSEEFFLSYKNRNYHSQYFHIYQKRLNKFRSEILDKANVKWDHKKINELQVYHCEKVLDIKSNQPCWVIGLTYCEMKYKPNILDDVSVGAYGAPPIPKPSYSDPDSDTLMLEDESGRVQLEGDFIKNSIFVTGNVIGILGVELNAGSFKVIDVIYPPISPQIERPLHLPNNKIAICSGLEIDPNNYNPIKLEILKEFLIGELGFDDGNVNEIRELANQISRFIIAGNSTKTIGFTHDNNNEKHFGTKTISKYNSQAMKVLDSWLLEVLQSLPVDIIPGETDPTEAIFPQQAINSVFFKKSKKYLSKDSTFFRCLTNPSWIEIDNTRFLGTGGQNINDMLKYLIPNYQLENNSLDDSAKENLREDLIEATINWQNIVPSSPDTLWTYPFKDSDPFTLTETPHVYFIGNQPKFQSKLLNFKNDIKIRILSIPKFNETGEIVLLDINSLEAEVIKIC